MTELKLYTYKVDFDILMFLMTSINYMSDASYDTWRDLYCSRCI